MGTDRKNKRRGRQAFHLNRLVRITRCPAAAFAATAEGVIRAASCRHGRGWRRTGEGCRIQFWRRRRRRRAAVAARQTRLCVPMDTIPTSAATAAVGDAAERAKERQRERGRAARERRRWQRRASLCRWCQHAILVLRSSDTPFLNPKLSLLPTQAAPCLFQVCTRI